jgi:hypothetical protein
MIRTHYALPEAEKGATAVQLISCDILRLVIQVQPGTATISPEMAVDPATFVADPDLRASAQIVADQEHFLAWYASDPEQRNPVDNEVQQVVSALLYYLWLQRKGQLPA